MTEAVKQPHEIIMEQWEVDCIIDDDHLDKSAIETSKLHSKYLQHLIKYKLRLTKEKSGYKNLRQKKFRYYRGEMSQEELIAEGWNQWQGIRPTKNDMDEFLEGDADLNKILLKIEYWETTIALLESIMGQLKARDWTIKNSIQWKMFIAGN